MSNDFGQISDDQRKALDIVLRKCLSLTKIVNDIVTLQKLEISGTELASSVVEYAFDSNLTSRSVFGARGATNVGDRYA